jgi:hypothetical protein
MPVDFDRRGSGVAAFLLSLDTLLALEKNGVLAGDELVAVVERSLARLKAIDAEPGLQSQAARESARDLLGQLHARLVRDPTRRELDF